MSQAEQDMSRAEQAFRDGDLAETCRLTQERLRKEPTAVRPRAFLFQVLALLGEWERARKQLSMLAGIDRSMLPLVYTYGPALDAEPHRARVFTGQDRPVVFGQPEGWTAMLVEALALEGSGRRGTAADLRAAAFKQAPATSGRSGQEEFAWIADADERLGPILETIVNGQYLWVPLNQVKSISVEPPREPVDLAWAMARFTWANGGEAAGLIPARYPGTERLDAARDRRLLLGRLTDWRAGPDGIERPFGQRMLTTENHDFPILDVREIVLFPLRGTTPEPEAGTRD